MDNQQTAEKSILLMSPERVKRSLHRMAYQIAEDNRGASHVLLIGLKERGFTIAGVLAKKLREISSQKVSLVQLPEVSGQKLNFEDTEIHDIEYEGGYTVIVDDVIFSGRTMLAAIELIMHQVDSRTLRTAALVDRGHRTMPVEATFAGLELPTKLNEHVEVRVKEDEPGKVILTKAIN